MKCAGNEASAPWRALPRSKVTSPPANFGRIPRKSKDRCTRPAGVGSQRCGDAWCCAPFRPFPKGALRGFATIELPIGLVIRDIPVLLGRNGPWASLPAKPHLGHDGRQKRDAYGKAAYADVLEWRDRHLATRFSDTVCALVRRAHPDALDVAGV